MTPKLLGISFKKPSSILCEVILIKLMNSKLRRFLKVEAYPSSVSFRWFFNNSEYQEWKDHGDFTQSGLKSQLEFLPKTSKDYGNLFCIGENAIGMQEEPCSFQIVPTGNIIDILTHNDTGDHYQTGNLNCCRKTFSVDRMSDSQQNFDIS